MMREPVVSLVVYGIPKSKGSKSAFPIKRRSGKMGVAVKESGSEKQKVWLAAFQEVVQNLAMERDDLPIEGPVVASLVFYMPKPKSAPKTRRTWPSTKPDLGKMARLVEDVLNGVVIEDDARIVEYVTFKKEFAQDSEDPKPRCELDLWSYEDYYQLRPDQHLFVSLDERDRCIRCWQPEKDHLWTSSSTSATRISSLISVTRSDSNA